MSPPRIVATLDLSRETERQAQAFIKRACSGRWPMWRLLGMRRQGHVLLLAIEWLRLQSVQPFSLVEVYLDDPLFRWRFFASAAEVRAALAALDVKLRPPTAPAAPAAACAAV